MQGAESGCSVGILSNVKDDIFSFLLIINQICHTKKEIADIWFYFTKKQRKDILGCINYSLYAKIIFL